MDEIISMELSQNNLTNNLLIWEDPKLREQFREDLTAFFQAYLKQNAAFSRGDFMRGGAYNVYFLPTSESYNLLGNHITVINPPADYAMEVIAFNQHHATSSGLIKQYAIIYGDEETRAVITFDTREVYQIESR